MDPHDSPTRSWSALPSVLALNIGNRLDSRLDRLRFRAVCSSWRSVLPPPCRRFAPPSPPLQLPFPMSPNPHINPRRRSFFNLLESTVYCLQPLKKVSDGWQTSKCWLIKIEETDEIGKVRLKDPLSACNFQNMSRFLPQGLNLLDYRVSEVTKVYGLQFVECGKKLDLNCNEEKSFIAKKVVVCSEGASFAVMAVQFPGKLSIWRMGDEEWTVINDGRERARYEDVIYFNGKFYAVDYSGLTISVDLSLNIVQVATAMPCSGNNRYCGRYKSLVNSMGDLFLLDRDFDPEYQPPVVSDSDSDSDSDNENVLSTSFNVYKLNEEKQKWVPVKSLGDRVMFVGGDCATFSVSAKDFPGCKRNCIYYTVFVSHVHHHPGCYAALYDMEDCSGRLLSAVCCYSGLFWPPPAWVLTFDGCY